MSERAETLFKRLQNRKAIRELVGKAEDGDFDCKEWHGPDPMKLSIAKAACGFANATGGVIVIGLSTKSTGQSMPDVVTMQKPVADREAVKSAALDIILKQVDPGIAGVKAISIADKPGAKSGFVVVLVPELDGSPQRSRADWKFYVRIASGTVPMEYFQIEDRFGRRPHARLTVELKDEGIGGRAMSGGVLERRIAVILSNRGRGLARFPSVRFKREARISFPGPMDQKQPIWPYSYADSEWISIRGGNDDIVYPDETLRIATLVQERDITAGHTWAFPAITIETEATCDSTVAYRQEFTLPCREA